MFTPSRLVERLSRRPEPRAIVTRGVWGSFLVLLGALTTNELPPGPIRFLVDPLRWLHDYRAGRWLGTFVIVIGMAFLAWAWVHLVLSVRSGPVEERLRRVKGTTILWSLPLLVAPPLFSHDGWSYLAQGALTQAGRDPYRISPGEMPELLTSMVDPIWRYTPTPYGPLPLTWGALCTEVTKDPTLLVWLQRGPVILGLVLTAWAVPRLAQRLRVDPAVALALTISSPVMLAHGVGGMHNDALVMGILACALVLAARHRWIAGVAVVGLAAGCKFTAIVAVVPVVLLTLPHTVRAAGRFSRLALGGLIAGIVVALCGVPYGLGLGWVKALGVPGVVITPASIPTAVGFVIEHVVAPFDDQVSLYVLPVIRAVGMALAAALVIYFALTRRTGDLQSALVTTVLVFGAVVLLAPVVHTWYALTILPAAVLLALRHRLLPLVLILGVVAGFTAVWDASLAGAGLLVCGAVLIIMALAGRYRDRLPAPWRARVDIVERRLSTPATATPAAQG